MIIVLGVLGSNFSILSSFNFLSMSMDLSSVLQDKHTVYSSWWFCKLWISWLWFTLFLGIPLLFLAIFSIVICPVGWIFHIQHSAESRPHYPEKQYTTIIFQLYVVFHHLLKQFIQISLSGFVILLFISYVLKYYVRVYPTPTLEFFLLKYDNP